MFTLNQERTAETAVKTASLFQKFVRVGSVFAMFTVAIGMFNACSKDDDEPGGGNGGDFSEVTVNGKTYSANHFMEILGAGIYGGLSQFCLIDDGSAEFSIVVSLFSNASNQNFKNSTTGTYRLGDYTTFEPTYVNGGIKYNNKNLDIEVGLDSYNPYRSFQLQAGGVHNVTDIKFIKVDEDGFYLYSVSGNYSCKQKDPQTGKIYDITGRYRRTITLY